MEYTVTNQQELQEMLQRCHAAQAKFATYTQEQVDKIFLAAATAANKARIYLAKMAVAETGMGVVEDKVIKNHYASEYIYNAYKNEKTCGVLEEDPSYGIMKIAEPIGVIGAVIPTTNPTSTAIFKALICLKTRNGIIFSPHPRAKECTIEAARIVLKAAVEAGAPEDIIGWISQPSMALSQQLMESADLILATGGPGMVRSAYSSGRPALGVGPGNVPAVIDDTADILMAVSSIIHSKTFDNGMICASEQSVIILDSIYDAVKANGIYLAAQCCEHLNRAIIIEKELALRDRMEIVNVVPQPKAGGSFATTAYNSFANPVAVEHIKADAGMDIGDTLIGMHLKEVAVPLRISTDKIGEAHLVCARTRAKFIGGERAVYDERMA